MRKIVNRGTFRKKSIVFHEANLQFERWTLRSGNETIAGPRFRLSCAFFAPATMQDSSNFAAKCPIVSRFIKWNLKRPHYERQLNPQWHTGAEEKKPRSWKRKQFVKYCFRRWQTIRIRDAGFRRFKERGKYLNFAKYNFEIYNNDNNSLFIRSLRVIFGQIRWNKTTKKKIYVHVYSTVIILKDILKD